MLEFSKRTKTPGVACKKGDQLCGSDFHAIPDKIKLTRFQLKRNKTGNGQSNIPDKIKLTRFQLKRNKTGNGQSNIKDTLAEKIPATNVSSAPK